MNRRTLIFVLALMSMLLVIAPATLAQETFGLSEADFALLTNANANMSTIEGVNLNFDVTIDADAFTGTGLMNFNGNALLGKDDAGEVLGHIFINAFVDGETFEGELRIIEGIVYANDGNGWEQTSLEEFTNDLGLGDSIPMLSGGDDAAGEETSTLFDPSAFDDIEGFDPISLITMTRVADEGSIAHFNINVDLQSFISSDAFLNMVMAGSQEMGDDSMAQMIPMLLMMFQDLTLSVDEYIDVENEIVSQFILNFGMSMDTSAMGGPAGAEPMVISFNVDVEFVELNPVFSVEAPE